MAGHDSYEQPLLPITDMSVPAETVPVQPDTSKLPALAGHFALTHLLTPESNGYGPTDFADINRRQMEYARPERMRPFLLDIPKPFGKVDVVATPYDHTKPRTGVAVTSEEYKLLGLSIANAGNRSYSRTRDARKSEENVDEKNAAARRSLGYTVNGMIAKRRKYIANALQPKVALIDRFDEAARYPNLSRGSEAGLLVARADLWTNVFKEMFDVMQVQREWTKDQTLWAARLADARLFAVDPPGRRAANLRGMLALAREWNQAKAALVQDQIDQGRAHLEKYGIELDDATAA